MRLFPGRPRTAFFSWAAFLGGIFFFRRMEDVVNGLQWDRDEDEDGRGRSKRVVGRLTARKRNVV